MYFRPGQTVRVKRDINRVSRWEWDNSSECPKQIPVMEHYASEGETGIVTEVFRSPDGGAVVFSKVNIDGQIKTFRLSSLDPIKP